MLHYEFEKFIVQEYNILLERVNLTDYFHIKLQNDEIRNISSLGLAHLGDAVFELMVRTWLCEHGKETSKGLHKATVSYVAAPAQAKAVEKILPSLTEEEYAVYKRGRNTRVHSVPSRATLEQYHAATGFEALFGYLYLNGETKRLNELFSNIMEE